MKKFTVPMAKNLSTGVTSEIGIAPQVYTSVHDWKPVPGERFAVLLHQYATEDRNLDEFGNGLMSSRALHLGPRVNAVVYYTVKEVGSLVSSPVLLAVNYETTGKIVCFASLTYGAEADPDRRYHE